MLPRVRAAPPTALLAAFAVSSLLVAPGQALAVCTLGRLAELPVTMMGLRPTVPVKINGADAQFIVDSGAFYSSITPATAAQFKLRLEPAPRHLQVVGIGGSADASVTTVRDFTLATIRLHGVEFVVAGSEVGAAGLLGQNILRIADTEYDLASGTVRLWRPKGCGKSVLAYWAKDQPLSLIDIPWTNAGTPYIVGSAMLNGNMIRAGFDTGASRSMLSRRAAERAGFKPDGAGVRPAGFVRGIGSEVVKTWIATFPIFEIGGEQIRNARLLVADTRLYDMDMVIGADFFLSHRVYVAVSQNELYFTYNGGPVFDLSTEPREQSAGAPNQTAPGPGASGASPPSPSPASPTPASPSPAGLGAAGRGSEGASLAAQRAAAQGTAAQDSAAQGSAAQGPAGESESRQAASSSAAVGGVEPADAAAFSRRGMAFAARREFGRAIADLTRACELDPMQSQYFYERGLVRLGNKQPQLAREDFDRALQSKPDDSTVLVTRAGLRLANRDRAGAIADLEAAERAAARQADIRLTMAALFMEAGQYAPAVSQFDLWIANHAEDSRKPDALNGRCWARALWVQELREALDDCDTALRMRPGTAEFLDSRALVEERMGRLDKSIEDYDAALRLQPKNAWMLYARGVAELRAGRKEQGRADIAAAVDLQPRIVDLGRARGVVP